MSKYIVFIVTIYFLLYYLFGDYMRLSKIKIDKYLLFSIIIFFIISLLSIYSAQTLLGDNSNFFLKQIVWYITGFVIVFAITLVHNESIYKYAWWFYGFLNILLLYLLFFGKPINDAKCWITIPGLGNFQPSEFMKIALIVLLAKLIKEFNQKYPNPSLKEEFLFLLKIGIVVFIPSILTFLEPDTGVVLIYLLITIIMLFVSGIRYRWFIILISTVLIILGFIISIYFINNDLFINIFGTSFFLRIDRLLDWSNKSGYQLENGLTALASAGFFGHGFNNTPIYFPEPQTDFIFAVYASNFGFIGSIFLISIISLFDIRLILLAINNKKNINKYIIAGIVGMLIYQQFQNIGMTFGLIPITGITLPFISYGGSSLLSYMIMLGIIFNISNVKNN